MKFVSFNRQNLNWRLSGCRYIDGGNIATEKIGRTVQALMNEQAGQGQQTSQKTENMRKL